MSVISQLVWLLFSMTAAAYLAMKEVFAQALSNTADTTICAVVNTLFAVIVPEFADIAIILCSLFPAASTSLGGGLRMST